MNMTVALKGHPCLPQPATNEMPPAATSHGDDLSPEEELRIMELELSILKKRRELAQRAKETQLKPVPEEDAVHHGKVEHLKLPKTKVR